MKICSTCKEELPLEIFGDDKCTADRLTSRCRPCMAKYARDRRSDPITGIKIREDKLRKDLSKYGITLEQFNHMNALQLGLCAICMKPEKRKVRGKVHRLCVDHCHETGVVRGLLCSECNAGLGKLGDTVATLEKALLYIKRSML